ncbi:dihydrofolate reductase family protein [Streptomyces sp. NBC_00523]|uniref:dihydrofolate reductase family protein n=1 Tax=Streptomyces sp. NBC_00523 TaxID=2975765 RepID=UPI002E81D408|nr:dihydrofolate reductase family protein [Streptomyces sp. NBC_00523]WUC98421.1 dihydrofolate reductase family protein [Streptomyces sp. NBC_00523]
MSVVVIEFITLDGVVTDPDGSQATPLGGWALRYGPEAVAGDKFRLGRTMDAGMLLLGRATWELFSRIWPGRDDPFAARMNAVPKLVASRSLAPGDMSVWTNSRLLDGDPAEAVKREQRDVVVAGSLSVVRQLMAADLVDEYRLLTFPTVLGTGRTLFPADGPHADLECLGSERAGAAVLTRHRRAGR